MWFQKTIYRCLHWCTRKIHDARVFNLSDISTRLPDICGKQYHIVGDGAYSIREWLLIPYKDYGNLNHAEVNFNKKFCGTRVYIENAFGLLKGRFRQLFEVHMHSVDKINKFIIACCVLHNFCIDKNDLLHVELIEENNNENEVPPVIHNELHLRRLGEIKRNIIKISLLM